MEKLLEKTEVQETEKQKEKVLEETQLTININNNKKHISKFILTFVSIWITISIFWMLETVGNISLEELLFLLQTPIKGTSTSIVWEYIIKVIPMTIIVSGAIASILKLLIKREKTHNIIVFILLISSILFAVVNLKIYRFVSNQIIVSEFIEENYVDARNANINFNNNQKNNLIYIYLESMESTYTSKENGGVYDDDLIKELAELAKENINFSNTEKLGGAIQFVGASWTIAGMVSQTSGMPLKVFVTDNNYSAYDNNFLPGLYTIGEVLKDNGYNNYLYMGSDAEFASRDKYFTQHGNYEIWDVNQAIQSGKMKEQDKVWWGYDDSDLITYAKEKLIEISKEDKPFNFTMLTVDTHFSDGYICDKCENKYDTQYANVISCSSKQISEFVKWIQKQDFYENTTIVISGDHLSMQSSIQDDAQSYQRTVFNTIINPVNTINKSAIRTKNRLFTILDMYPTTLAAIGATIDGDRLGLGTNLFSNTNTIMEEVGQQKFITEIEKSSEFYNKKIVRREQ